MVAFPIGHRTFVASPGIAKTVESNGAQSHGSPAPSPSASLQSPSPRGQTGGTPPTRARGFRSRPRCARRAQAGTRHSWAIHPSGHRDTPRLRARCPRRPWSSSAAWGKRRAATPRLGLPRHRCRVRPLPTTNPSSSWGSSSLRRPPWSPNFRGARRLRRRSPSRLPAPRHRSRAEAPFPIAPAPPRQPEAGPPTRGRPQESRRAPRSKALRLGAADLQAVDRSRRMQAAPEGSRPPHEPPRAATDPAKRSSWRADRRGSGARGTPG